MKLIRDERVKQVVVGVSILLFLAVTVPSLLVGWRSMPGLLGETIGTILGIMTTPFLMETSFIVMGFLIVISINQWRRHRDGDEFIEIEKTSEK